MKAAIYNPYLNTLGGGERYTVSFANELADLGFEVDIEWKNSAILTKLSDRFGLKFSKKIKVVDSINRGENYDLCFWVSDGSIPTLRSSKNYLHFQVPFHDVDGRSLLNKMKLFRINKVICNSLFTKKVIDKEYGVSSAVLYPPVDTTSFRSKRKTNQICYVGRFSNLVQNKGHEILIEEFKKLIKEKGFKNWKLVLAGGTEVGSDKYLKELKEQSANYNIQFVESPTFETIKDIYGKSKIFWSAAGFGIDEETSPENTEHFGITLVESMSSGCVPVAYDAGGHKEIVENNVNGFLWKELSQLVECTKKVVNDNLCIKISKNAVLSSRKFNLNEFKIGVSDILK